MEFEHRYSFESISSNNSTQARPLFSSLLFSSFLLLFPLFLPRSGSLVVVACLPQREWWSALLIDLDLQLVSALRHECASSSLSSNASRRRFSSLPWGSLFLTPRFSILQLKNKKKSNEISLATIRNEAREGLLFFFGAVKRVICDRENPR